MADPFGYDNSIDSVLSEGSQSSSHSKGGTPRRAHPALFPKSTPTTETQGTIKASRLASPPNRTNSGGISAAFADPPDTSPLGATGSRKKSSSPTPSTPSNISGGGKGSKGRSSTARRNKMKSRKSIAGISEDDSSASETEGGSVRIFEQAFQKFDKTDEGQIAMSDFLLFFDALQQQLPPLSEPLLKPDVREQMLNLMSQVMAQSDTPIFISKEDTKNFYKSIAGKDITQELNERRQGSFPQNGEVSSFRGRLQAARLPDLETVETPKRPSAMSPERRTPFGGAFARPVGPRRQQSNGFGSGTEDENSDVGSVEPSTELTGNFLASSTPAQAKKKIGHGYFSPPITSPTHSALSMGDFPGGGRSQIGSPGFNTSAVLEQDLAAVYQELRQKQADFDEKEQELAELRHRADRNREDFEEEITSLNEESGRLRKDLAEKRQEITQLNRDKDELRAEAAVYLDQISEAKKDVEQFQYQHNMDRENILALSQDNQRYAQQAADAIRRVEALTADLQTVMEQKEEVEVQRSSLQKKADLITGLHKQIKDLREEQKDREFEIERLRTELHNRQLDIEMMMSGVNPARTSGVKGSNPRDSVGPGFMGVLSDELAGVDDDDEEEEEEDEEEEVVTTTKTIKRRKKPIVTRNADISTDEPFEVIERVVDTTERGVQVDEFPPWTAEMGTSTDDDLAVPMFTAETQTEVTVDVGTSLQDHFEALAPLPQLEFSIDEEGLQKISEYEELAKRAELTRQQLEELSQVIGVQSELIERFKKLGEANAGHRVRKVVKEKYIPGENPIAYLNYATYWLQNWFYISVKQQFKKAEKGGDEWADFLESNARPDFNAVVMLVIFFLSFFVMGYVILSYTWKIQSHEAMWRNLNTLKGYPRNAGTVSSGGLFGSRTWRVFKYDIQQALFGQVRFPI
ncbi:hypothetical protein H072_8487 [Dactylellina haptotyla CBS 200.50]|uniref:EF-hand domain-containing protein n=1 Tax=Dactylellina haptotyla (strain CBS 200.50) TaxID=1284197 RepID=S8A4H0_DACHA|nr:hypothetical protein H072_8487 [Dactylellina haptotyla CBS 200.50]